MKTTILLILLLSSTLGFACECGINSYPFTNEKTQYELFLEDSFENATIIFYGRYNSDRKFEINKFYKGKNLLKGSDLIEQTDEKTLCDDTFKENKMYLIFGKVDELGKLRTSICYANLQIEKKKELKFVKEYLKK